MSIIDAGDGGGVAEQEQNSGKLDQREGGASVNINNILGQLPNTTQQPTVPHQQTSTVMKLAFNILYSTL